VWDRTRPVGTFTYRAVTWGGPIRPPEELS
jgi:hypothetical protein